VRGDRCTATVPVFYRPTVKKENHYDDDNEDGDGDEQYIRQRAVIVVALDQDEKKPLIDNVFTFFQPLSPVVRYLPDALAHFSLTLSRSISLVRISLRLFPFSAALSPAVYFLPRTTEAAYDQPPPPPRPHTAPFPIVLDTFDHSRKTNIYIYIKNKIETIATLGPFGCLRYGIPKPGADLILLRPVNQSKPNVHDT